METIAVILTIVESPYAGRHCDHIDYARRCLADSLRRGEAPLASHLLYTQPGVLDDDVPSERELGINAGHAWMIHADLVAVYCDLGISNGMWQGLERAASFNIPIHKRLINEHKFEPPFGNHLIRLNNLMFTSGTHP